MPTENVLALALYTGLALLGMLWLFRVRRANPVFWFIPFQWLIGAGTIAVVDLSRRSDAWYVSLFFISLLAFLVGALVASPFYGGRTIYRSFWQRPIEADPQVVRFAMAAIVVVSVLVTIIYYRAVGYNLLLDLALGRGVPDFTSARLAAYSGERYYAPGYINQFKNVLLPLGLSAIGGWAWHGGKRRRLRLLVLFALPLIPFALVGAGQRGPLVYALLAFLMGLWAIGRIRPVVVGVAGLSSIVIFGILSFHLGRIEEFSAASVLSQLGARAFVVEQGGGLEGFRYIFEMDTAWFSEWGQGFAGILPWHSGSDIDHVIFGLMHGSERGTATLATVASAFHNGGLLGVIGLYVFLGWSYTYLYWRFLSGARTILRCFTYGAIFFNLAFFVAGAPASLANKGVVALLMVLALRKLALTRTSSANPRHHRRMVGHDTSWVPNGSPLGTTPSPRWRRRLLSPSLTQRAQGHTPGRPKARAAADLSHRTCLVSPSTRLPR